MFKAEYRGDIKGGRGKFAIIKIFQEKNKYLQILQNLY